MSSLLSEPRNRSLLSLSTGVALPSSGAGSDAIRIEKRLRDMRTLLTSAASALSDVRDIEPADSEAGEQLRQKLAALKRLTAAVAMHLDRNWRNKLFGTLDRLLDPEDWDSEFRLPSEQSFSTFLRMIIYLHPTRRPGLGLSPGGHFLAAWTKGGDRIVVECLSNDEVRWVLSRTLDGQRESGAGKVLLHRIPEVTAAYEPEALFNNGERLLA
jgi:hypothetical protein